MPIDVTIDGDEWRIVPTERWQELKLDRPIETFAVDRNFYVTAESTDAAE
jgi:hypothetical protein